MRISVVIPSYNRRHSLQAALQSILEQTSVVDEIILVDDGSSDGTAAMVSQCFPQVKILRQANLGVSAARNRGIAFASCEWIALLDSDDSWLPQKIARIREIHRQRPDFELYHSDEIWVRRGRRVNPMKKHRKTGGWIFESCLPLCAISPSASVIRKATLESIGMFDEDLPACEDYDLWLRLCHRFPVCYLDEALIIKQGGHADQLSRLHPAMDRFRIRALDRLLKTETLRPEYYRAARSTLIDKLEILVNGACKHGNRAVVEEFAPLRDSWRTRTEQVTPC
jgi:glycosyltransferase involved in cell wall biosynthesis